MGRNAGAVAAGRTARAGRLIHRRLLPFPIALLVGTLIVDIAFAITGDPFWTRTSMYLLVAGLMLGAPLAAVGLFDFLAQPRMRESEVGRICLMGNLCAVVLSILNLLLRVGDPAAAVSRTGLMLSTLVSASFLLTSWFSGEVTFRDRAGVIRRAGVSAAESRHARTLVADRPAHAVDPRSVARAAQALTAQFRRGVAATVLRIRRNGG